MHIQRVMRDEGKALQRPFMMRSSGARIDWANKAKGIAVGTAKLVEVESNFPCIPKAASALRLGPSFLDVRLGSVNALAGSTDSQLHALTVELRDYAHHRLTCVCRRILQPENPEILEADRRERGRHIRAEKREGARLLICRAGVAVNDKATEPSAPALCRSAGKFNPKVRKFDKLPLLLHRERIYFGNFSAVEAADTEPEVRRQGRGRRGAGCRDGRRRHHVACAFRRKTYCDVSGVVRRAIELRHSCLGGDRLNELAPRYRNPISIDEDPGPVLFCGAPVPSRPDPFEHRTCAAERGFNRDRFVVHAEQVFFALKLLVVALVVTVNGLFPTCYPNGAPKERILS